MEIKVEVDDLIKWGLSPCEYVYLKMLYEGFVSNKLSLWIDTKHLYDLKYIDVQWEDDEPIRSTVKVTSKVESIFGTLKDSSNIESWIDEWRDLFPSGLKQGGYSVRSDKNGCLKKMIKFCKEHTEYNKNIIFEATKYYLAVQKKEQYKYIQLAHYFIHKGDNSALDGYCEDVFKAIKDTKSNINDINKTQKGSEDF